MIPVNVRIFVCIEPVDMRSGFDRLALLARDKLQQDPRSGALLIFTGRRRDRLKALWWDRNGYCILYNQLYSYCTSFGSRSMSCSPAWWVVLSGRTLGERIPSAAMFLG